MTTATQALPRRTISCGELWAQSPERMLAHEWLVTNGLGGYSSSTVVGMPSRSYHGLLIAALPAPLGRVLLIGPLSEQLRLASGRTVQLAATEYAGGRIERDDTARLVEFALEAGLPVWTYRIDDVLIEKRVWMPHRHNTAFARYRLLEGPGPVRVKLLPTLHFRSYDAPVDAPVPGPFRVQVVDGRVEVTGREPLPLLRMKIEGGRTAFTAEGRLVREVLYRIEASRGYRSSGELVSPGYFRANLTADEPVTLTASCETWETLEALPADESERAELDRRRRLLAVADPAAREGMGAELVLAADQFLVTPASRVEETARLRAAGDEARTVIAGYHWFTDWGRDTMISLEGLTLVTGRHAEAGYILRTFAKHVRDGLIPNYFPDGKVEGVYHTADATLWFFQALSRYVEVTNDRDTLRSLLPTLREIVRCHVRGTRFGIGVDPKDGLLRQGAEGYQLTWMDAKVGDWVVTPRRGKAVEINALWYNALGLLRGWLREEGERDDTLDGLLERCRSSFNRRFWNGAERQLFDVVDGESGDDPACRPNQLLAIALPHAVLDRSRWESVLGVVRERLLTPVGLRSLAPGHPDYKPRYDGDLRSRDAAYHQGTVWAWLIGPYLDAWLRLHPDDRAGARRLLQGFESNLSEACVGSISEIFDAEPPYTPRGCVAQAWSVAEVLRLWARTAG